MNARKTNAAKLDHRAINPPSASLVGEKVFAQRWQDLMALHKKHGHDPEKPMIEEVLRRMLCEVRQRHATVAATFIQWLGTNGGRAFIDEGERLGKLMTCRAHGYLGAWAVENYRCPGINSGIRAIEYILAPADYYCEGILKQIPEVSADDYEVVEHVIWWLAEDGREFLQGCLKEIERQTEIERDRRLRKFAKETDNHRLLALLDEKVS
jgi:hypothetical protein